MPSKDEIQAQIEKLQKELADSDDDDFDIEIWSGDKGARVPYSKGKSWFEKTFGIELPGTGDAGKPGGKKSAGKPGKDGDGVPDEGEGTSGRPRVLRHLGQQRDAS